jgi:hypothetical protein
MSRQKRKSSPPPTPTTSEQQQEQWERDFAALNPDDQEVVRRGTDAAKAVCGSRLAVAKNLSQVRDVLCRDLTNPKQKRKWTLYLQVMLPGLATSRSQTFRDIQAWRVAQDTFRPEFLNEFLSSGYAFSLRPTIEQPLGKMTEPCQHRLEELGTTPLNSLQLRTVLMDAADAVKRKAKENRAPRPSLTAEQKRNRILKDTHEAVINGLEDLSKAIEQREEYSAMRLRDDLELIVNRLMTATGIPALESEPRELPEGFKSLSLPEPNPKPSKKATRAGGSGERVARGAKRESLHTHKAGDSKGTVPASATMAEEVPSVA